MTLRQLTFSSNLANDADYMRLQGLNADGTRNDNFEVLLDVDNLIGYMTEILYSGNPDAPISNFFGNNDLNNYYAIRDRTASSTGFKFFVHDAEHAYGQRGGVGADRTGPYTNPDFETLNEFNPQTLHQELMANDNYRTRFMDFIQKNFFNDGPFTVDNLQARWDVEAAKISSAIIAESARWGDARSERVDAPLGKTAWTNAVNSIRNNFIGQRQDIFLNQLRSTSPALFPNVDAPEYLVEGVPQHGGEVTAGSSLVLAADDTIYYTTDGSDPRSDDGSVSSSAVSYDPGVVTTNLFGFGSTWNYLDNGSNQGTAWRSSSFDDSTWNSDVGQFGYGNNGEQNGGTTVEFGNNASEKHITTYFRKTFNVPAGNYVSATLDLIRDDGAVVYLDGVEIKRDNFGHLSPTATIAFDTEANNAISNANEGTPVIIPIDLGLLAPGSHTLAIEIHQQNPGSSDLSFDAKLEVSTQSSGSGPLVLNGSTNVKSRTFSNGEWSALSDALFAIPGSQSSIRISEINFNPYDPSAAEIDDGHTDSDSFEFVEIYNSSLTGTVNLSGMQFDDGITFTFGNVELGPGERAVVAKDTIAFQARYGTSIRVLGEYGADTSLSNGGEQVILVDSVGEVIHDFTYSDDAPWPVSADGDGPSLEVVDVDGDYSDPANWRASATIGGTPGAAPVDVAPQVVSVIRDGGSIRRPDLWTTFAVQFSSDVDVNAAALSLVNDSTGGTPVNLSGISLSYDTSTSTATWDLSGLDAALPAAFYTLTLNSNLISGSGGVLLDGNDSGSSGGTYTTEVYQAIPGDANLDGRVNVLGDGFTLVSNLGTIGGSVWAEGDFNADDNINVLGDGFPIVGNLNRNVNPPVSSLVSRSIAQPISQSVVSDDASQRPVLFETMLLDKDSSEDIKKQTVPVNSIESALAGSQSLDDAFASDDWLI